MERSKENVNSVPDFQNVEQKSCLSKVDIQFWQVCTIIYFTSVLEKVSTMEDTNAGHLGA